MLYIAAYLRMLYRIVQNFDAGNLTDINYNFLNMTEIILTLVGKHQKHQNSVLYGSYLRDHIDQ